MFLNSFENRVQIRGKLTNDEMIPRLMSEGFDLILGSAFVSQYIKYQAIFQALGIGIRISDHVDFFETSTIAAKVELGSSLLFAYFQCFPTEVWTNMDTL